MSRDNLHRLLAVVPLLALLCSVASARADAVDMTKGKLVFDGSYATQFVSAKNNTRSTLEIISVDCGFFRGKDLLVSGGGNARDVGPGEVGYIEVIANHGEGTDRTDCRLKYNPTTQQKVDTLTTPMPSVEDVLALQAIVSVLVTMSVIDHTRNGKDPKAFLDLISKTATDAVNTGDLAGSADPAKVKQAVTKRLERILAGIHF